MSINLTEPAETSSALRKKSPKRKWIALIMIVMLIVIATVTAVLEIQSRNDKAVSPIVGAWYSETEDLQYHFSPDKTYFVTNGQQTLVEGQWRASWKKGTVVLTYTIEESTRTLISNYAFRADQNQLTLQFESNPQLVFRRITVK